jgi:hypothetical protein
MTNYHEEGSLTRDSAEIDPLGLTDQEVLPAAEIAEADFPGIAEEEEEDIKMVY